MVYLKHQKVDNIMDLVAAIFINLHIAEVLFETTVFK